MKRLKIRGITGMPLFIVRFSRQVGWQTKRRGLQGREMGGPLSSKERGYLSFICPSYIPGAGMKKASQLHKESVSLAVEYHNILEQLTKPDPIPSGGTNSSQARQKGPRSYNRTDAPRQEADHKIEYGRN